MKRALLTTLLALGLLVGGLVWYFDYRTGEPRRVSLQSLSVLNQAIHSGDAQLLLQNVAVPAAIVGRTPQEQFEFLAKALRQEISPEGLTVLQREGEFGTLSSIFPAEAVAWAQQAGVKPEDCVAFNLERNGLRTEVVLVRHSSLSAQPPSIFKIVRCNNVTAPATIQISTKDQP